MQYTELTLKMLEVGKSYRLSSPTVALRELAFSCEITTVPEGSVVTIRGEIDRKGFVRVRFDGDPLKMFACDVEDRGELTPWRASEAVAS